MSNRKVKVKICGVTLPSQAREIAALGADYIGCVIEFSKSPRSVTRSYAKQLRDALKGTRAALVGVAVDIPLRELLAMMPHLDLNVVQLHGNESPEYVKRLRRRGVEVWKVVTRENYTRFAGVADAVQVDAVNPMHGAGGSGMRSDWDFARQLVDEGYTTVLSGGLNPDNVQEGITRAQPLVVDVSSGVEASPGIKDLSKVVRFITKATMYG